MVVAAPSLVGRRGFAVAVVLVGLVALGLRLWLLRDSSQGLVPVGPDAEDWVLMARSMLEGHPAGFEGHRYPLVPWLAAGLAPVAGGSVLWSLALIAVVCGSLGAVLTCLLARRLVGPWLALVAGLWVALAPGSVLAGVSTTAYPLFVTAFLVALWALLRPKGWSSDLLGVLAAFAMVASLTQGLLCLLVLLPVSLLLRRWRTAAASALGAGLGLALVRLLHPSPHSPLGWMAGESWRYLSGNLAEEQAARGAGFVLTWVSWATRALLQPPALTVALLLLAVLGLALGARRPAAGLEARLPRWLVGGVGPTLQLPRGTLAALVCVLLPLGVLMAVMGSPHHLLHLQPVLVVAALLGLLRIVPGGAGPLAAAALVLALGGWSLGARPALLRVLGPPVAWDRAMLELGRRVEVLAGSADLPPLLVTVFPPGEVNPVHRGLWACPLGTGTLALPDPHPQRLPAVEQAYRQGQPVVLVSADPSAGWAMGPYTLELAGSPVAIVLDSRRQLLLAPARLVAAVPSPPVDWPAVLAQDGVHEL